MPQVMGKTKPQRRPGKPWKRRRQVLLEEQASSCPVGGLLPFPPLLEDQRKWVDGGPKQDLGPQVLMAMTGNGWEESGCVELVSDNQE